MMQWESKRMEYYTMMCWGVSGCVEGALEAVLRMHLTGKSNSRRGGQFRT